MFYINFWKLESDYIANLPIDARLYYKDFKHFGIMLFLVARRGKDVGVLLSDPMSQYVSFLSELVKRLASQLPGQNEKIPENMRYTCFLNDLLE